MKKSNLFLIIASIGIIITIALTIGYKYYEKNVYQEALYHDDSFIPIFYSENDRYFNDSAKEKKEEAQRRLEDIEKPMNVIEISTWIAGGITAILLITGIVLKIKEKGGIKFTKKNLIRCLIILAVIIASIGIYFLISHFLNNPKANMDKQIDKLSQINSKELEEKIIKKIEENPNINISNKYIKTTIGNPNAIDNDSLDFDMTFLKEKNNYENLENVVFAFYEGKDSAFDEECHLEIPLFVIESDENGNFKKILFNNSLGEDNRYSADLVKTIKEVFEQEYQIGLGALGWMDDNSQYYTYNDEKMYFMSHDNTGELMQRVLIEFDGRGRTLSAKLPELPNPMIMSSFGL